MKSKFTTKIIVEIAIFASIALALDYLQGGLWRGVFVNGGSIGLSMIPIIIIAYRRGFIASFSVGIIVSLLQMLGGIYVISSTWYNAFIQIALDYVLTFPAVALSGLFYLSFKKANTVKQRIFYLTIGTIIGGLAKFFLHFLAGILFWKNFDFQGGFVLYSLIYNGSYMLPNIIISTLLIIILFIKVPILFGLNNKELIENIDQKEEK